MSGELYEVSVATLLFLRCLRRTDAFHLACNHSLAGAFDDLVLVFRIEGRAPRAFFVQLKYKKQRHFKRSTLLQLRKKDGFSLPLYCKSYGAVVDGLERLGAETGCRLDADAVSLVIFTNTEVETEHKSSPPREDLLATGGWEATFDATEDGDVFGLLADLDRYRHFLESMLPYGEDEVRRLLKTSDNEFNTELQKRLRRLATTDDLDVELRRLLEEARQLGNTSQYAMFLDHVTLLCAQADIDAVRGKAREELRELLGSDANYEYLEERVTSWWRGAETYYLTQDGGLFRDLCALTAQSLNRTSLQSCTSLGLIFNEEVTRRTKQALEESGQCVAYLSGSMASAADITTLRLCQALPADSFLILAAMDLRELLDQVLALWRTSWYRVLIVKVSEHPDGTAALRDFEERLLREMVSDRRRTLVAVIGNETASSLIPEWPHVEEPIRLMDLDADSRNKILNAKLHFQGHVLRLRDVRVETKDLSAAVIQTLSQGELPHPVGKPLASVVDYYVPRVLTRRCFVKNEFARSPPPDSLVALTGPTAKEAARRVPIGTPVIDMDEESAEEEYRELCEKNLSLSVHWLHREASGNWKWVRSSGSVRKLENYLIEETVSAQVSRVTDVPDRVVPIVAVPGMGKSTLLNEVAQKTKAADPGRWVIRVDLGQHTAWLDARDCDRQDDSDALLERVVGISEKDGFARNLLLNSCDVAVLLDAFDEISPTYTQKGAQILRWLASNPRITSLWVTSRPVTCNELMDATDALPFELEPFKEADQKDFLTKYWRVILGSGLDAERLDTCVGRSLMLLKGCLGEDSGVFAEVPLHAFMVAEAFSCGSRVDVPETVDVVDLYARFVDKKMVERLGVDMTRPETRFLVAEARRGFEEKHMRLAMRLLLPVDDLPEELAQEEAPSLAELDKLGFVFAVIYGRPQFVHKTFAEYFAALWLSRHDFPKNRRTLHRVYDDGFEVLRSMLDRILAHGKATHLAALDVDVHKLEAAKPVLIRSRDAGGRTPLTLAAIRGHGAAVRIIASKGLINDKDDVLGWTPLQYAEALRCWDAVEALLVAGASGRDLKRVIAAAKTEKAKELMKTFVEGDHKYLVKVLLHSGTPIDLSLDSDNSTALTIAALNGHLRLVRFIHSKEHSWLRRLSGSLRRRPKSSVPATTPLHRASQMGYVDVMGFLLKELPATVNALDESRKTPLHVACAGGHLEAVQLLLDAGANVDRKDHAGRSPLQWASGFGHSSVIQELLSRGASVDVFDMAGETPLHWAASDGDVVLLQCFLREGASVNVADRDGQTPLHKAANHGSTAAVSALLDAGADVHACDVYERDAFEIAIRQPYNSVVKILVEKGVDINKIYDDGETLLIRHAALGRAASVQCLVDIGADVERRDVVGRTALHCAVAEGRSNTVQILLTAGANVNAGDAVGHTPLHLAAKTRNSVMVGILLQAKAEALKTDRRQRTPLHLAAQAGGMEAARLLARATHYIFDFEDDEGYNAPALAEASGHSDVAAMLSRRDFIAKVPQEKVLTKKKYLT